MNIKFTSIEKHHTGIIVYISKTSETDFNLTKALINSLRNVEIIFRQNRINVPLTDLFKSLVIIKGNTERAEINKNFKAALYNWKAFFETDIQTIVFDLNMFKGKEQSIEEQLTNTLVHEIGHCIHVNFVTPGSKMYITSIGEAYTNIIGELKAAIEIILGINKKNKNDRDISDEDILKYLVNKFYDFADFLDNSSEKGFSSISSQICSDYEESNNVTLLAKIESMIASIMKHMPSEYGSYDEREFFAECFRQFILYPDQLSLSNRNIIINALTISRVQGKTVMNAHKDLSLFKDYIKLILT